jgi:malonyl-CoA/methylmalonyl-CoA synthetase
MNSIVAALSQYAQHDPQRTAILFEDQTITYAQLSSDVTQFAHSLMTQGIQPGKRIAIFLDNCPEFIVAYLGIQLARGIVVLVNSQYRQVELQHIMTDSDVHLCITNQAGKEALQRLTIPALTTFVLVHDAGERAIEKTTSASILFADFVARGTNSRQTSLLMPAPSDPAVIGYTSGTTGLAKGALLIHSNLTSNIAAITTAWHWSKHDRLLLALPLFHAHGLMVGMHGTLFNGASVILRRKFAAVDILSTLHNDSSITLFFGVPTMYIRLLAEAARQGVPSHPLRLFVSGSAPLSPQVFNDFARVFGQRILERYGMTETIMNMTNPYEGERRAGTVGQPFPGQEGRVVDILTRELLPANAIGEIEVRGPHVFGGYWKQPAATAAAFSADGWFKTGDLGWYSDDGYYTITGRARELIISGGYNIYPREIEDVLTTHPEIAEAAVIGAPDPEMGEQVVAIIVPKEHTAPDAAKIIAFCRERLASYKKPRRIIFVDSLPRNALGKVQKHLLNTLLTF